MPRNGLQLAEPPATHGIRPGRPHPLGATADAYGVNFAVFSRHATGVELFLFGSHDDVEPAQVIRLDPDSNRSFFFWHVYVEGLRPGAHYAYRVAAPLDLSIGHRFNRNKVLIDPYARGHTKSVWKREAAYGSKDNLVVSMRSVVIDTAVYDREGGCPLNRTAPEMITGENGAATAYPPVWNIELSRQLLDTKGIAQARDVGGLYQTGFFPGYRWSERSRRYRDVVRRFVNGEPALLGAIASRIAGSPDIEQAGGRLPLNSNFVTCHDGFTLNDLVSYDNKHNRPNGEYNRDGINDNSSWNCGVETPLANADVEALRVRQIRNFTAILLLSQGVPMFVAGDEGRRPRQDNNAYCQDNVLSWFAWSLVEDNEDLLRFYRRMINFRKRTPALRRTRYFTGAFNARGLKDMTWSGCRLGEPDWQDSTGRALAFTMGGFGAEPDLHVMMNMYWEPLVFDLPSGSGSPGGEVHWYRTLDTAMPAPDDIADPSAEVLIRSRQYAVSGRSVVVLLSKS